MTTEPVLSASLALSLLRAALMWVLAMGWITMNQSQLEQTLAFGGTLFLAIDAAVAWWIRHRVTPTA